MPEYWNLVERNNRSYSSKRLFLFLLNLFRFLDLHQQGSFDGVQSGDVSEFFPSINTITPHLTSTAIILPNSPGKLIIAHKSKKLGENLRRSLRKNSTGGDSAHFQTGSNQNVMSRGNFLDGDLLVTFFWNRL